MQHKISILLPTINEGQGIGHTLDSINTNAFAKHRWSHEIIIVDGDSKDNTQQIAKEKGANIILEKRKGYGRAYKTGMAQVTGDIIVTGDADATYPFDHIHEYIHYLLENNLDFLTTDRFASLRHGSMSIKHHFGNWMLSFVLRILFQVNIKDSQSGMWIFKTSALDHIQPLEHFHDGMPFSEEIKIEMFTSPSVKAEEIPSMLYTRLGDVKLESFSDGWKNMKFLFKKRLG